MGEVAAVTLPWVDAWDASAAPLTIVISGTGAGGTLALDGSYVPDTSRGAGEALVFKKLDGLPNCADTWLYFARDGRWHVGSTYDKDRQRPSCRLRSQECEVGQLPGEMCAWEVFHRGVYGVSA